jgi:2-methylcitrate dehydratase PrpD
VGTIQGAIQAIAYLVPEPLRPDQIESVNITVPQTAVKHGGAIQVPTDMTSAQFSFAFSTALRIVYGSNKLDFYEDPAPRSDPDIIDVCRKVHIIEDMSLDPTAHPGGAKVEIKLTDGTTRYHHQVSPSGAPDNLMTWDETQARYYEITDGCLDKAAQDELNDLITNLETLDSVNGIGDLLRLAGPRQE